MDPVEERFKKICNFKQVLGVGYKTTLRVGDPGMLFDRLITLYGCDFSLRSPRALR